MSGWRTVVLLGVLVGLGIVGCGKSEVTDQPTEASVPAVVPVQPVLVKRNATDYNVPFDAATVAIAPEGFELPPDKTFAGKPAAKLADDARKVWPSIALTDDAGLPMTLRTSIETEAGTFEITLHPDVAPNHVRNFLALSKVGYFDGLVFERVVQQVSVSTDGTRSPYEFITAGCPVGDGTPGRGHLGYFLKPEISDITHEEGTVGFWREDADESAGVRFYITLGPAPLMDKEYTVIGKVTLGLDTLRKIADMPAKTPGSEQPLKPVAIRKVTANR